MGLASAAPGTCRWRSRHPPPEKQWWLETCASDTYRAVKFVCEEDLDLDLIVAANNTLAGPNEVAGGLSCLDLEHDRDLALVDELDRGLRSLTPIRTERNVRDGVQCHEFAPVLLLGRRPSKRGLLRHALLIKYYTNAESL